MRRIKNFEKFLLESKVKLDKELREYSLTHKTEALFQVKSHDFFKEFSVKPYNSESLKALPSVQKSLEKAMLTSAKNIECFKDKDEVAGEIFDITRRMKEQHWTFQEAVKAAGKREG